MRKSMLGLATVVMLAGCGGDGEDFAIEVKRGAPAIYAPLAGASVQEAAALFPGIKVDRSRPTDTDILYTIPGTGDFASTIRLRLEPRGEGVTIVHGFVRVPPVRATIEGQDKVLSERKVENALRQLVRATGKSVEMGSDARAQTGELSALLTGLAVATNKAFLARALDLKNNPEMLLASLDSGLLGSFDSEAALAGAPDAPTTDLDRISHREDMARSETEWKREKAMENAAAPTTDLDKFDRQSFDR